MDRSEQQQRAETSRSDDIERRARTIVESDPRFVGRVRLFNFQHTDDVLVVEGCVPTYYVKQLLQNVLKDLEGVRRIDNRVQVDTSEGVIEPRGPGSLS